MRADSNRLLSDDLVVLAMCAYPYPHDAVRDVDAKRSVMDAGANRPELAYPFEVERGVTRICTKQLIVLVCDITNLSRERVVQLPEFA